jgi:Putative prokaryotic signal transducing protein
MATEPLACPSCGALHPASERFCATCGMPLVHADRTSLERPVSAAHERARKIRPQYTEGALVRVAGARNQAEAELIQGLLLEEGIPSMLRRTAGFDVPDYLAAGPRAVLVPEAAAEAARELLHQAELAPTTGAAARPSPVKLFAAIALGGAGAALVAWLLQGGT